MIDLIQKATTFIQNQGVDQPEIGVILGTGLSKFLDQIKIVREIEYAEIPHFPTATVEFHEGKLVFGELAGKTIVVIL